MIMKLYPAVFVLAVLCQACGSEPVRDRVDKLQSARGEWTMDQTDEAIDLYLEGLQRESDLLEQNMEIRRQTDFFSEKKCAREVLEIRRAEIDKARTDLAEKRARLQSSRH